MGVAGVGERVDRAGYGGTVREESRVRVAVTGATGFIGRALSERLVRDGIELRVLARDPGRADGLAAEVVQGSITDAAAVDRLVAGADTVFHVAGSFREPDMSEEGYREVNVAAVRHVIEAARRHGARRVVHTSTVGIHGSVGAGPPAAEDSPIRPVGLYEETKAEGDALALAEGAKGSPEVVVVRPTPVYGPGDTRLVKLFRLAARERPLMLGDGRPHYHMIYIDDLVDAFLLAARRPEAPGQAFIIGGAEVPTLGELVAAIGRALGRPEPRPVFLPAAPVRLLAHGVEIVCRPFGLSPPIYRRRVDFFLNDRRYATGKANRLLGFAPGVSLDEGLRRTAEWYKGRQLL